MMDIQQELLDAKESPIHIDVSHNRLPMFTPKQAIGGRDNILTRLIRGICVLKKFTIGDLEVAIRNHSHLHGGGMNRAESSLTTNRNNMMQALSRESVSFNKVLQLLSTYFGYQVSITITITDQQGVSESFNTEEVYDKVRQLAELEP